LFHCFVFSYEAIYLGKNSFITRKLDFGLAVYCPTNFRSYQSFNTNYMDPRNIIVPLASGFLGDFLIKRPFTWAKNPFTWPKVGFRPTANQPTNQPELILWTPETIIRCQNYVSLLRFLVGGHLLGKKFIYLPKGWFLADSQPANQPTKTNSMDPRNNNQVSELCFIALFSRRRPFTWEKIHLPEEKLVFGRQPTGQPINQN